MAKKDLQPKFVCVDCGKTPAPDKEKSTVEWTVYPTVCPDCGGRVTVKFEEVTRATTRHLN